MVDKRVRFVVTGSKDVAFKVLSRRLRDYRQPITPETREFLASIVDSFAEIHAHQETLTKLLQEKEISDLMAKEE